jgi:hypothetical protein|tara:strand:- start:8316 stop:9314 length:999 start_codon:yes stop_codon:yes gene_type:complete
MALLLRRGTQAECDAITPAEGELIYTTDTNQLYAGDGATLGGVLVSADAATTLNSLTDTDLTGASNGDHLAYNSGTSKWEPANDAAGSIGTLSDVNGGYVNGDLLQFDGLNFVPKTIDELLIWDNSLTANLTGNTTGLHTGPVDGDVIGSVFGDDSTIIIDGVNNTIYANDVVAVTNEIDITNQDDTSNTQVNVKTSGARSSLLNFSRISTSDLSSDNIAHGRITFSRNDSNGLVTTGFINATNNGLFIFQDSAANAADPTRYSVFKDGALGIGTTTPAATLDVQGAIKPGVYADDAARDAAITTPTAGMMVFNTTGAKFQGYDGTSWVNLN